MLFDLSLSISCEERVRERIVFVLSVLTDTTMQRESEVPKEENIWAPTLLSEGFYQVLCNIRTLNIGDTLHLNLKTDVKGLQEKKEYAVRFDKQNRILELLIRLPNSFKDL